MHTMISCDAHAPSALAQSVPASTRAALAGVTAILGQRNEPRNMRPFAQLALRLMTPIARE